MACGWEFTVATTDRGVVAWGANHAGQCGQEVSEETHELTLPRLIQMPYKMRVVGLSCGSNHTLLLNDAATVLSWGSNSAGQCGLGHGSADVVTSPAVIQSLWGLAIAQVAYY